METKTISAKNNDDSLTSLWPFFTPSNRFTFVGSVILMSVTGLAALYFMFATELKDFGYLSAILLVIATLLYTTTISEVRIRRLELLNKL